MLWYALQHKTVRGGIREYRFFIADPIKAHPSY